MGYCFKGEQPPSTSGYWRGFLDRQPRAEGVVQRCGLTSDCKAAPRPSAPAHPRQSQYVDFKKAYADNPPACKSTAEDLTQHALMLHSAFRALLPEKQEKSLTVPEAQAARECCCECMDAWQAWGSSSTLCGCVRIRPRICAARARTVGCLRSQEHRGRTVRPRCLSE